MLNSVLTLKDKFIKMKNFRLVDNILGWLTFFIAAFVYCSTIEPTASFWDCPEFITTGAKLEVGHPPGAPFFMLTANLFSHFASSPATVAAWINTMNALLSAACIMFLFWTITHLVRRLLVGNSIDGQHTEMDLSRMVAIEASGLVGALIYTFSDTFWFSAVEGEVYAYSSAFTAVVFWLILKWEEHADEPHSDRWLVLIMYMTGLSIGVHLLNLLCLPAIVLVWYYRRFPNANLKGSLVALVVSFVLLAAVLYGVVPGIITVGGWFEWFFVNDLGLPFNSGVYVYLVLLVGSVLWAIYETQKAPYYEHLAEIETLRQKRQHGNWVRQNVAFLLSFGLLGVPFYGYGWSAFFIGIVVLAIIAIALFHTSGPARNPIPMISARLKNTALLCMLMLMIGYSTYAVIVIRSSANPPMDQNSPEDIFTLGNYLSRDQYGYRPLLVGQAFESEPELKADRRHYKFNEGAPIIQKKEKASADEKDSYFVADHKRDPVYAQNMLFPRMYSSSHASFYKSWHGGITGRKVPSIYDPAKQITMPTFWENMSFFITYQCNFMYWRYFLWNFAGRQNDIQGNGEVEHGNWITGFSFIDNAMLGDQSKLPDYLKNNKGHNVFYCMPLLLGIIGLFWQMLSRGHKGIQQFWVVFFLFFMTGLAIVVYLNQTPMQPRERDYAYAGSFYAYAIWCGMGVAAIINWLNQLLDKKRTNKNLRLAVASAVSAITLLVPIQMASQTWDDHDRSGRFTCRDFGQNYLQSLQQEGNPVIFTCGDNDTFPLWYNQDTEGVRTDARVCNLSYLQTDWYIDQMVRPAYDSPALPVEWSRLQYVSGTNDYIRIDPNLKYIIEFLQQNYPKDAKAIFGDNPFELSNVMKEWVRDERTPEKKDKQLKAIRVALEKLGMSQYFEDIKEDNLHVIPTDTLFITIDKDAVRRSGMLTMGDSIPDRMAITLDGMGGLDKSKLMMLEMVANANWERPLYVAMTVGADNYMSLGKHFVQEGLVYRITPYLTRNSEMADFDVDKTYDCVMNRFKWGGVSTPGVYLDETVMRMCLTHRQLMVELANRLVGQGDSVRAMNVLDKLDKELPVTNVPYDMESRTFSYRQDDLPVIYSSGASLTEAQLYIILGQEQKAKPILDYFWKRSTQWLDYYLTSFRKESFAVHEPRCLEQFNQMLRVIDLYDQIDQSKSEQMEQQMKQTMVQFTQLGGSLDKVYWNYM